MPRRKAATPVPSTEPSAVTPTNGERVEDVETTFEPVKINNANLQELKIACDDAVRRYFSRSDQFRTRHTHTDVRLALGWTSVLVAGATGYYGWKRDFEESKTVVAVGVALYFVLTLLQTAYTHWVEGKTIFIGKRRTLANRIEAERIRLSSETKPAPAPTSSPLYALTLSYTRYTGGGKSKTIIRKAQSTETRPYTAFFNEEGTLDEIRLVRWLSSASASVLEEKEKR